MNNLVETTVDSPTTVACWHTLETNAVERFLETGPRGLDAVDARRRLEIHGPNRVQDEVPAPWWTLALHQIRDPIIYVLCAAGLVTLALRDFTDSAVIFAVVLINGIVGFLQEHRAQRAIRALSKLTSPKAEVLRAGVVEVIDSTHLVPGDVVLLTSGARVPADLRLNRVHALEIDESALTGESVPSLKTAAPIQAETLVPGDQSNMAFAGTIATRGRGRGYVVRTGSATELGRIAESVREIGVTTTPLQQRMVRFGKQIALVVVGLSVFVLGIGLLHGMAPAEIFLSAVALAVSAIPEGLPIAVTVTMAVGVRRMARRRAIVRSLPAVETLGSATVIGSDKTGTLTRNEMTVRRVWTDHRFFNVTGSGYSTGGSIEPEDSAPPMDGLGPSVSELHALDSTLHQTLLISVLANEAEAAAIVAGSPSGDPTEIALLVAAAKGGIDAVQAREEQPQLELLPFEPERRFMATRNEHAGGARIYLKGAPEAVLAKCDWLLTAEGPVPLDEEVALEAARTLSRAGLRVLAMAYRPDVCGCLDDEALDRGFILAGLEGMEDPVRPEAIAAVAEARAAGIRVLMLTGDHVETARAIGRQLDLGGEDAAAVDGRQLEIASDDELDTLLDRVDIYARVAPEHKLRIVQRLRHRGEVVAVTGDGVNDAPALRAAHLGIAMGKGGTDVAREASAMVLADDNFATITGAIEEGRVVFSNIRKVTFFLLSTGLAEIITVLVALAAGFPLPFVAVQILWINLVTNGLQDVALAFEKAEPDLLRRPPRPASEGIVTTRVIERLLGVGAVLAAGTLAVFWYSWQTTGDLAFARTMAMTQMVVFQFFHVFNCRSLDRSILRVPLFSNPFLFVSFIAAWFAHAAVLYWGPLQHVFKTVPLGLENWGLLLVVGVSVIVGGELDKWRNRKTAHPLG